VIRTIHFANTVVRVRSQFAYLELPSIANWLLINTWRTLCSCAITIYVVCVIFFPWSTKTLLPSWHVRLSLLGSTTVMHCYMEPRATVYSVSRIHLREWCAMHHSAVRLNRFANSYIGCRSNNEFSTRLLWWLTRFGFINKHSIYVNSSTTMCLLVLCFIYCPIDKNCNSCSSFSCSSPSILE